MDGGVTSAGRRTLVTVALAFALAFASALPALGEDVWPFNKEPYRKGTVVRIEGQVTDAHGRALPEVTVIMEVSRRAFRLKKLSRETGNELRVPVKADADGRYRIDWRWDPFYNLFALSVALPVRKDGRESYEVFHQTEVTPYLTGGNPVGVPLVLADRTAFDELRAFLDSVESEDEKRIYMEMGRPDRVDVGKAHYDPDRSWWYFEAGKVYRFQDGKLDETVTFEPVPPEDF